MKIIPVELTALSSLGIAQRRGVDNVLRTLDYIPGSTWRGALAQEFLRQGLESDPEFIALFKNEQAWFGDLLPEQGRVIPRTAITCKYKSGFCTEDEYEFHGVQDAVLRTFGFECYGKNGPSEECQVDSCRAPLQSFSGYYRAIDNGYEIVPVRKTLIGHTQIDARTHTAKENTLYTLETLDGRQTFSGEIRLQDNTPDSKIQNMVKKGINFWVGSDRTRGLGRVNMKIPTSKPQVEVDDLQALKRNFLYFNEAINEKYASHTNHLLCFTLTLESRAIVLDHFLRYKPYIDSFDLNETFPDPIWEACHLIRAWNATAPVDGWNSKVGFPKLSEMAIVAGSVFLFAADKSEVDKDELCQALLNIQVKGLGVRKVEGFGRVRVCDPFHWQEERK